jgi:methyltransferase (TIGR00027 family)
MTQSTINGVALTSLWVAAARATESESAAPLFRDPFARRLAGEEGFAVLAKVDALSPVRVPTLAIRTRHFDDEMTSTIAGGIRQIVSLAAGMDARAYRLDFPQGTTYFEIDQPHVLAYKAEKLVGETPRCDRREVRIDLRGDWQPALVKAGLDENARTLWLVEGLLQYLEETAAKDLLARISRVAPPKSVLYFDLVGRSALESPFTKHLIDFVAGLGAPWIFGSDEPEALLEPLGWRVEATEFGVIGLKFQRWPFPVPPRGTPGVPHSFLVKAIKEG